MHLRVCSTVCSSQVLLGTSSDKFSACQHLSSFVWCLFERVRSFSSVTQNFWLSQAYIYTIRHLRLRVWQACVEMSKSKIAQKNCLERLSQCVVAYVQAHLSPLEVASTGASTDIIAMDASGVVLIRPPILDSDWVDSVAILRSVGFGEHVAKSLTNAEIDFVDMRGNGRALNILNTTLASFRAGGVLQYSKRSQKFCYQWQSNVPPGHKLERADATIAAAGNVPPGHKLERADATIAAAGNCKQVSVGGPVIVAASTLDFDLSTMEPDRDFPLLSNDPEPVVESSSMRVVRANISRLPGWFQEMIVSGGREIWVCPLCVGSKVVAGCPFRHLAFSSESYPPVPHINPHIHKFAKRLLCPDYYTIGCIKNCRFGLDHSAKVTATATNAMGPFFWLPPDLMKLVLQTNVDKLGLKPKALAAGPESTVQPPQFFCSDRLCGLACSSAACQRDHAFDIRLFSNRSQSPCLIFLRRNGVCGDPHCPYSHAQDVLVMRQLSQLLREPHFSPFESYAFDQLPPHPIARPVVEPVPVRSEPQMLTLMTPLPMYSGGFQMGVCGILKACAPRRFSHIGTVITNKDITVPMSIHQSDGEMVVSSSQDDASSRDDVGDGDSKHDHAGPVAARAAV
jgi:hypothetical protein